MPIPILAPEGTAEVLKRTLLGNPAVSVTELHAGSGGNERSGLMARVHQEFAEEIAHFLSTPTARPKPLFVSPWRALNQPLAARQVFACLAWEPQIAVVLIDEPGVHLHPNAQQSLWHCIRQVQNEPFITGDSAALHRLILARQAKAERLLIASATVEYEHLTLWDCQPKRYDVPIADIPALRRLPAAARANFELDPDGSFVYWPEGDVHIGMDVIHELTNPTIRKQNDEQRRQSARRFAGAIRAFRRERGLTQKAIPGLSSRQLRRLELGDTIPHSTTLQKLADAHGLDLNAYLAELAKRSRDQGKP